MIFLEKYIKRYAKYLWIMIITTALVSILNLITPLVFSFVIDNVISKPNMYIKYIDSSKSYNLYFVLRGDNCFFTINKKDGSYVNLNNYLDEHKNDSLSDNEYFGQIIPILYEFLKNNQDDIGLESLFRKIQEFY